MDITKNENGGLNINPEKEVFNIIYETIGRYGVSGVKEITYTSDNEKNALAQFEKEFNKDEVNPVKIFNINNPDKLTAKDVERARQMFPTSDKALEYYAEIKNKIKK